MKKSIKEFFKAHWQQMLWILLCLAVLVGISFGTYYIFRALGYDFFKSDKASLAAFAAKLKSFGIWWYVIFLLLEITVTVLMCMLPGTTFLFIKLALICTGENLWEAVALTSIGVLASSMILFLIGDKLGEKVAIKIAGEAAIRKAQNLIDTKSTIVLPVLFMLPLVPCDGLCLVAGMTKMKYGYFAIITTIFRTIGNIIMAYTWNGITWIMPHLETPLDWIFVINIAIIDCYLLFKFINWAEKKLIKYRKKREEKNKIETKETDE